MVACRIRDKTRWGTLLGEVIRVGGILDARPSKRDGQNVGLRHGRLVATHTSYPIETGQ